LNAIGLGVILKTTWTLCYWGKKKKKIKHQVRFINNNLKENLIDTYENEEELVEER